MNSRTARTVSTAGLALVLVSATSGAAGQTPASAESLVRALQAGGYVLVMRHASSPREAPSATDAQPDNPTRERQLDAAGRAAAIAMGEALRRLRIPLGDVL